MKTHSQVRSVLLPLACLAALGSLVSAQAESKPITKAGAQAARPKEAAAREMGAHLKLAVTGLTPENSDTVRTALSALQVSDYVCKHCDVHMAMAGKCPTCSGELMAEKVPMFGSVKPGTDSKTLSLMLSSEHPTRLSEIQKALKAQAIALVPETLPIAGKAELLVSGGTADSVAPLTKALETSKLFQSVHVTWNAAAKELHVVTEAGASAPTDAKVQEVLQGLKLRLDDIVWGNTLANS